MGSLSFSVRGQPLTTGKVWSGRMRTTSDIAGVSGRQPGDKRVSPCLSPPLSWVTLETGPPVGRSESLMVDDRPAWARRMLNERQARGWSQADAIKAMRAHAPVDPRTQV